MHNDDKWSNGICGRQQTCVPMIAWVSAVCGLYYQNNKSTVHPSRNTNSVKYVYFLCRFYLPLFQALHLYLMIYFMIVLIFMFSINIHIYYLSNENPDVLKEKPTGNCPLKILFELAAADELNLDVSLFPPTTLLLFFFAQADKTFISWAFCNHCTTPTGRPQSKSTPSEVKGHCQMKTSY